MKHSFLTPTALSALSALLAVPAAAFAQTSSPAPAPAPTGIHRWLDIQTLNLSARYRRIETTAGVVTANHLQHNETVKARLLFDAKGRVSLVGGLGSGTTFTGGWNNAGVGTPDDVVMRISMKQLYLSVTPTRGIEAQYGGLYLNRGESTEITTYDNDGYMAGGRLIIKRPDVIGLDELSGTFGYLGDAAKPHFFRRSDRLSEVNYYQALAAKRVGVAAFSADLTSVSDVRTLRGATTVRPSGGVIDLIRAEGYHRFSDDKSGYAVYAEKNLTKRFALGAGAADIDPIVGTLNADRFAAGQRWFSSATFTITPELSLLGFYQHMFNDETARPNRQRVDVVLQFNALKALQRAKWY